jgi:uroporphyrinogen-III synthase
MEVILHSSASQAELLHIRHAVICEITKRKAREFGVVVYTESHRTNLILVLVGYYEFLSHMCLKRLV